MKSSEGAGDKLLLSIVWQCPHCDNTSARFAHRQTCTSCGADQPALVAKTPECPHVA